MAWVPLPLPTLPLAWREREGCGRKVQPCGSNLHPKVCARCPAVLTTYHLHLKMSQSVSPEAFWKQGLAAAAAPRVLAGQTGSQTLPCNLEQVMSPAICAGRGGCLAGRQCGGVTLDQTRCRAPLRFVARKQCHARLRHAVFPRKCCASSQELLCNLFGTGSARAGERGCQAARERSNRD